MATSKIKGLDEPQLEGGIGGAGVSGTRWSSMPSFKGKSSMMGDIKKLTADTSHLKGGAKKAVEEAKTRAARRTAVRAAGADAAYEGGKAMMSESAAKDSDKKSDAVEASFRNVKEEKIIHTKAGSDGTESSRALLFDWLSNFHCWT